MPIQLDFILRRLVAMAEAEPELRERQPWKAAYERDYAWFGSGDGRALRGRRHERPHARRAASSPRTTGISVEDFEAAVGRVPARGAAPDARPRRTSSARTRRWSSCSRYLEANGFSNYIASGGGRDFMRPISQEVYGIPRERVIGSASALEYVSDERGGTITHKPRGRLPRRRPAEADPHLEPHRPPAAARRRQLERRHPDARVHRSTRTSRSCACSSSTTTPSASSTTRAAPSRPSSRPGTDGWTVVSVKDDWATVFPA